MSLTRTVTILGVPPSTSVVGQVSSGGTGSVRCVVTAFRLGYLRSRLLGGGTVFVLDVCSWDVCPPYRGSILFTSHALVPRAVTVESFFPPP